jgi:hypothetical protein
MVVIESLKNYLLLYETGEIDDLPPFVLRRPVCSHLGYAYLCQAALQIAIRNAGAVARTLCLIWQPLVQFGTLQRRGIFPGDSPRVKLMTD